MDEKETEAKVMVLASMIEYQEGSVVSRTLIKKKSGTVTLFAFDKAQELSEHSAPYDAIVEVLEGSARITLDGEAFEIGPGELIILPAKRPHAVFAAERFKMMLIMIRSEQTG